MTTAKIAPESDATSTQKSLIGQKHEPTKGYLKSKIPRYILLAVAGILVAICAALLLNFQKVQDHDKLVPRAPNTPTATQEPEIEQQPALSVVNAYDYEWEYGCVIAIEIGETYSRVGASVSSSMEIFFVDGQRQIPNYAAYTDDGILVGQEAKDQALVNPKNTIFDFRRIIGRRFTTDPLLQGDIDSLPYDVVIKDDKPIIKVHVKGQDKFITPEEVQAEIMKKLKTAAGEYYGQEVNSTIITVPAYFNDNQRQAMKDAAVIANLNVLRLINEPTAAAIAHNVDRSDCPNYDCEEYIVVYNLGENHVDVTVSSIEMGIFEIMGTASDRSIGGQAFDDALLDHVVAKFQTSMVVDGRTSLDSVGSFKAQVKEAEESLSTEGSATITFENLSLTITQDELQSFYRSIFDKSVKHIEAVLKEAKLQNTNVSHLIITGNTTQVFKMQPFLEELFDGKKVHSVVSSDQAVLRGAVMQAELFSDDSGMHWVGAFDITVLSLGLETTGGIFKTVIPRHTMTPRRSVVNITTINDNQSKIVLNIFEGERPFVANNRLFGTFNVTDLPPRPAGELLIEVAFEIDLNDILRVTARELEGGKETVFQSTVGAHLRYEDIDSVMMDAESHVEEDYKRRSAVDESPLQEDGDEFGVIVVLQEGEKPIRWYWDEREGRGYNM